MKKFCSVLLSILFGVALLFTILLGIVRNIINPSNITKIANELFKPVAYEKQEFKHNNGLFYPDEWNIVQTVQFEMPEGLDLSTLDLTDLSSLDLVEIINEYGKEYGIEVDQEFIDDVMSDPETSKLIDTYMSETLDYLSGNTTELNIEPQVITNVVNKTIDKYEAKTGVTYDRTGLNEAIEVTVKESVSTITENLEQIKEENSESFEILNKVYKILSLKVFIIAIVSCFILLGLILLINKNIFVTFKFISIPGIVIGVILYILGIVVIKSLDFLPQILPSSMEIPSGLIENIVPIVKGIVKTIRNFGIISTLISVVVCVFGFKLGKTESK